MKNLRFMKKDQSVQVFRIVRSDQRKKNLVPLCLGPLIGILICSSDANAQNDQTPLFSINKRTEKLEKQGLGLGVDIWSATGPAVNKAAKIDDDQELIDQLAELRLSLGSGIGPMLERMGQNPQELEIIFVDEIKRLAKEQQQTIQPLSPQQQPQKQQQLARSPFENQQEIGEQRFLRQHLLQSQQPMAPHNPNTHIDPVRSPLAHFANPGFRGWPGQSQPPNDPPVTSENMLRPIQANMRDEPRDPRRATQASHGTIILRKSARLLEQAAAELEEVSRFQDADQLRQQASRLWRDAR